MVLRELGLERLVQAKLLAQLVLQGLVKLLAGPLGGAGRAAGGAAAGVGEGAMAGAGTLAGYEAMQRGMGRSADGQEVGGAPPAPEQSGNTPGYGDEYGQGSFPEGQGPQQFGNEGEGQDLWGSGDNDPWSGGGDVGGGGGAEGGGGGFFAWIMSFFFGE